MVTSPEIPGVGFGGTADGELSDDEDETETGGINAPSSQVDDPSMCLDCIIEDNRQLCELAKYMIEIGAGLGPFKLKASPLGGGGDEQPQPQPQPHEDDNNPNNDHINNEAGAADNDNHPLPPPQLPAVDEVDVQPPLPGGGVVDNDVEEENRFEIFHSILTVTDSSEKTPLHILCEQSADSNMMKTILESTTSTTANTTKKPNAPTTTWLLSAKDSRGSTPLHYLAYSRQCPYSSLEMMMDYTEPVSSTTMVTANLSAMALEQKKEEEGNDNSMAAVTDVTLCVDGDGDTPLHWALDGYVSSRRVKQLLRFSKEAIQVKNAAGKSPFDLFVANFVDTDWAEHDLCGREVWENIQGYLKVVFDIQEDAPAEEWFPVHLLASSPYDFPPVFMDMAIKFNKEDLLKPNSTGHLPLHLACARKTKTEEETAADIGESAATKILLAYPQAAIKPILNTKRLALHIAIENQKPLPLIAALLKIYPSTLNAPDPNTGLWPFLLAGSRSADEVDISYSLLRADPSIIQVAIRASISKRGQRAAQARREMESDYASHDPYSRRTRRFVRHDDNM